VLELAGLYAEQKELLDKVHEKEGVDVFVATYMASRHAETESHNSVCSWAKGVPTLLPVAEQVYFYDPDLPEGQKVLAQADWDIVRFHCGQLMTMTDHPLRRWRVEAFPTVEQLEAVRAAQALRDGKT
jgi:hypothetical protein